MRDGKIVQSGKYDELLGLGTDFETLVAAHDTAMELVEAGNNNSHGSEENGPKSLGGAPFSPGREAANGSSDNKLQIYYLRCVVFPSGSSIIEGQGVMALVVLCRRSERERYFDVV
ncbi:unnamed protein product [Linum tenue]|uniref:Uncharacterized protein n=1 Tax=Linum tenue TaxID=586396 RepID=A0AAV0H8G6_9ROSI|nr:unnamed protein product [Linum tenue]